MNKEVLKYSTNKFNYIHVDKIESLPMVKLSDPYEFAKFVNESNAKYVCVYEPDPNNENDIGKFFITYNGIIYWIPRNNYNTVYDMIEGMNLGLEDGNDYYLYKEMGFKTLDDFYKFKESGFKSKADYYNGRKLGFLGSFKKLVDDGIAIENPLTEDYYITVYGKEGYQDEYHVSNDGDVYYLAMEKGFRNFEDFYDAMKKEFGEGALYYDALRRGFDDVLDYFDAIEGGFSNAEEYYSALEYGIRKKDSYTLFLKLKKIMKEYNLPTFEEAFLYDIIESLPGNSYITLDAIWDKLTNDERILLTPKEKLELIAKDESDNISLYQKWYSRKFNNKFELMEYILNNEYLMSLLKYDSENDMFIKRGYDPLSSKNKGRVSGILSKIKSIFKKG